MQSKKEGKDQESIQSSNTPCTGMNMKHSPILGGTRGGVGSIRHDEPTFQYVLNIM